MAIMERHGVGGLATTNAQFNNGGGEAITVTDAPGYICVSLTAHPLRLTPEQARYLAKCFENAADRIEAAEATENRR